MGEKFTLNEHNLNVRVTHNKTNGTYTAAWGSHTTQTAHSGAGALRMLADEWEILSLHGAANEQLENYRKTPDILCKYCHAPIFFAVLASSKYLAFDIEPVAGDQLTEEDRTATFPRTVVTSRGQKPLAVFHWGATARTPQYIPHPQTCGGTLPPPESPPLRERWEQNRAVQQEQSAAATRRAVAGLRNIRDEIAGGAFDANDGV